MIVKLHEIGLMSISIGIGRNAVIIKGNVIGKIPDVTHFSII